VTAPDDLAARVEKVRLAAQTLFELIEPASAVGAELVDAIRTTQDEVRRRLAGGETTIALLGGAAARRSLLNAIVGARAFDPKASPCPDAIVSLRPAHAFDYTARMLDGSVLAFGARGTSHVARAVQRVADRRGSPAALAPPYSTAMTRRPLRVVRAWQWLVRLVARLFGRRSAQNIVAPPFGAADESAARMADQERGESFLRDLRALTDGDARGLHVLSISVQCPTSRLPADITLVDGGDSAGQADGAILVTMGGDGPTAERLAELARAVHPARIHLVSQWSDLGPALEHARAERPAVACARAAMAVRRCMTRVSEEGMRAKAVCDERIAALERQRMPDPGEFRAQQLLRVDSAIEKGARDVEGSTLLHWREEIAHIKRAWRADIEACTSRKEAAGAIERLNRTAAAELQARVDDTVEHAIADLQRTSETIQIWLLEEIHARYHVARRAQEGESPAAVIGEAIDMPALGRTPLESTLDKFETRRVDFGLGGAAAGAVVGTLVVPGIGTAIGAFVGVFAGLLKGVDSLKQECVVRLAECLGEIERDVAAQIAGRRSSFEEALRASLHDALDQALERRQESIARLTALERKALDSEYDKRAKLATLRALVDEHAARIR